MGKNQQAVKRKRFDIVIDRELCKGCNICVYMCPTGVLKMSDSPTDKGVHVAEVKYPDQCTGCLACELNCPDFAIYVRKKKK
ncbi:MAG: 4Fe-4S binding protein [Promethearchaeota archaeon]